MVVGLHGLEPVLQDVAQGTLVLEVLLLVDRDLLQTGDQLFK